MDTYNGVYRDSGIKGYECGPDCIKVDFMEAGTYCYSYDSAGREHIENMKALAKSGKGLNSYINDHTRDLWEWREVDGKLSFNAPYACTELDPGPRPRLS